MAKPRRRSGTLPGRTRSILLLHGPNLNLLGSREPGVYGTESIASINNRLSKTARSRGAVLEIFQSNHEGALIERIHQSKKQHIAWIIVNPAGLTHTSVALRDALAGVSIPYVEVHLSNIHAREPFRRHSYFSDLAVGTICGLGSLGYDFALQFVLESFVTQVPFVRAPVRRRARTRPLRLNRRV